MAEIAAIVDRLWQLRRLMLVAVLVGLVAAVVSIFRLAAEPPFLESRSTTRGFASAQVLLDSRRSALTNVAYDIQALSSRARIFVQLVATDEIRQQIASDLGITAGELAVVPLVQRIAGVPTRDPSGGERTNELRQQLFGYRLEVQAAGDLPVLDLRAQAPDAESAARLANAAAQATVQYLTRLGTLDQPPAAESEAESRASSPALRAADRQAVEFGEVRFRQLGTASAGTVTSGGGLGTGVFVGVVAFFFSAVVLLFLAGLIRELRLRRQGLAAALPAAATRD